MTVSMKLTDVLTHLMIVYEAGSRETRLLVGDPGIGKTTIVREAARRLRIGYRSYPATVLDPLDIGGLPVVRPNGDGRDHAYRLPFSDLIPSDGAGILVFEDLTTAPPLTQASLYSLTWDRHVGSFKLGDDWLVVCTANPDTANAATNRMPTPLVNRMEHLYVEADFEGWEMHMASKSRSAMVRAFLHCSPQSFVDFDPLRPGPFPTARSWEACCGLFETYEQRKSLPPLAAIAGWIGEAVATQLVAFSNANGLLVSPDEVFADPAHAPIPSTMSAQFVLITALANTVTSKTFPSFITFIERLSDELSIFAMKSVWLSKGKDVVYCDDDPRQQKINQAVYEGFSNGRAELLQVR